MPLYVWFGIVLGAALCLAAVLGLVAWRLLRREPYAGFLKLGARQKLRFFRSAMADRRVPLRVKIVPVALAMYLAMPIDLVPDFIPVLGYLDDVVMVVIALALIVRLTPNEVLRDLLVSAGREQ